MSKVVEEVRSSPLMSNGTVRMATKGWKNGFWLGLTVLRMDGFGKWRCGDGCADEGMDDPRGIEAETLT